MSKFDTYEAYLQQCPKERWIALQNFQGIRGYTKIPLAPITLLYGQNSAGKSSIHDAFHFINGFFSGEWDHETTTAYLDRWANNKRITNPLDKDFIGKPDDVVIGCAGLYNLEKYYKYCHVNNILHDSPEITDFDWLFGDEGHNPTSFRIHFSYGEAGWYLREFVLYLGADIFLNYVFYGDNPNNFLFGETILSGKQLYDNDIPAKKKSTDGNLHDSCLAFNRNHEIYDLIHFENWIEVSPFIGYPIINNEWFIVNRLGLLCEENNSNVSTPKLSWDQLINWYDYTEMDGVPESINKGRPLLRKEIENMIGFPVYAIITDAVINSIPPIRDIPTKEKSIYRLSKGKDIYEPFHRLAYIIRTSVLDKIYIKPKNQNEFKDPAQIALSEALIALSVIADRINPPLQNNSNENPLAQVNRLLTSSLFLDTGYEIVGDCKFIIPEDVIYKLPDISKEELRAILEQLEAEVHLRLRYIPDDLLLEIEDVGVGISQVIPVLLAANSSRVYIQQPELHLHPKLQAQLADVFVEQVSRDPIFVIETHSEHFLLRILRRIRETYRSDIAHTLFSLNAEDVVVLYVDKTKEGTSNIVQLRLSEDGEFIDRWPNGFFTERDGELFDE
jgi:predicted ATPase